MTPSKSVPQVSIRCSSLYTKTSFHQSRLNVWFIRKLIDLKWSNLSCRVLITRQTLILPSSEDSTHIGYQPLLKLCLSISGNVENSLKKASKIPINLMEKTKDLNLIALNWIQVRQMALDKCPIISWARLRRNRSKGSWWNLQRSLIPKKAS